MTSKCQFISLIFCFPFASSRFPSLGVLNNSKAFPFMSLKRSEIIFTVSLFCPEKQFKISLELPYYGQTRESSNEQGEKLNNLFI
jgi:hypothetical protein